MYKIKAEYYNLKCDEINSMIRTGFHVRKQYNHFSLLSLPFSVPNAVIFLLSSLLLALN